MALSEERNHVMFAQTITLDVFYQHHLVVTHTEHGAVQEFFRVLVVATGQKSQRFLKTFGGVPQAVALGILSNELEHAPHQVGDGFRFFHADRFGQRKFFRALPFFRHRLLPGSPMYSKLFRLVSSTRTRSSFARGNSRRRLKISMQIFSVVGTRSLNSEICSFK